MAARRARSDEREANKFLGRRGSSFHTTEEDLIQNRRKLVKQSIKNMTRNDKRSRPFQDTISSNSSYHSVNGMDKSFVPDGQ